MKDSMATLIKRELRDNGFRDVDLIKRKLRGWKTLEEAETILRNETTVRGWYKHTQQICKREKTCRNNIRIRIFPERVDDPVLGKIDTFVCSLAFRRGRGMTFNPPSEAWHYTWFDPWKKPKKRPLSKAVLIKRMLREYKIFDNVAMGQATRTNPYIGSSPVVSDPEYPKYQEARQDFIQSLAGKFRHYQDPRYVSMGPGTKRTRVASYRHKIEINAWNGRLTEEQGKEIEYFAKLILGDNYLGSFCRGRFEWREWIDAKH